MNPESSPACTVEIYDAGDYWYITSSDFTRRVVSDDSNKTMEDVINTVENQLRILFERPKDVSND